MTNELHIRVCESTIMTNELHIRVEFPNGQWCLPEFSSLESQFS